MAAREPRAHRRVPARVPHRPERKRAIAGRYYRRDVRDHGRRRRRACSMRRAARCAICGDRPSDWHRCTSTTTTRPGAIRGILCFDCNHGLGKLRRRRRPAAAASRTCGSASVDGSVADVASTAVASLRARMTPARSSPPRRRPGPELRRAAAAHCGRPTPLPDGADTSSTITHGTTVAGRPLRRRRGDGRRPAGHLGQPHQPTARWRRCSRPTATAASPSPAPPGPAIEMVKLFQLQLEHYEKVEGAVLSLEGKANQLGQMVRSNLPAAMQGLAVVPLFAGYDLRRGDGPPLPVRRHRRPLRGARLPRRPARAACTPARSSSSGYRDGLDRGTTPSTSPCTALFQRRRRGLGHRRARPRPRHLPRSWPPSPPRASSGSTTSRRALPHAGRRGASIAREEAARS